MIEMSKNIPYNITHFLNNYKQKMQGSPNAIQKFQLSLEKFNQCRLQSTLLRKIEIYPQKNDKNVVNNQLYVIKIEGRKNTYYQGRIIPFFLFVFDMYPEEPPEIIAPFYTDTHQKTQKPFLHLNMDHNGHVCMLSNQKNKQYYKYTTLKDILIQLENTIYVPNTSSSYPSELFQCYKIQGDNSEYFQKLNFQAKFLQPFEQCQSSSSDSENDY